MGETGRFVLKKSLWYPLDIKQMEALSLPAYSSGKEKTFTEISQFIPCYVGSLSLLHGASSGSGWRNGFQIGRLAANILNKQPWTANRGGPPAWGLGVGLTTPHRKKNLLRKLLKSLGPGRIFWINDPSYGIQI
jgi:hypothetical protein